MRTIGEVRTIGIVVATLAAAGIVIAGTQFRRSFTALVPVVHAQSGCSNSSLRGSYGFQIRGTVIGIGPIGGVALVTFDGGGNFTQTDYVSVNGFITTNRPGSGTYSVNADCTGTQTLDLLGGKVVHTNFTIAANARQVFDVVTDPSFVIDGVGKAVGHGDENEDDDYSPLACSPKTIQGTYAISTTGSIVAFGPLGAVADVGRITFDGNGGASQTTTVSLNGLIIPARSSIGGSFTVDSDCTGEVSLTLPGPAGPIISTSRLVVVDSGNQLLLVNTGVGRVLAGAAIRQRTRN